MPQHPGDIVTVPYAELDVVDPLIAAFGALAEEDGDPDRMVGRRLMKIDMVSKIFLYAASDYAMKEAILILHVPLGGMTMGLIEDLCTVALGHHAASFNVSPPPAHEAWHVERIRHDAHLRPVHHPD